MQSNSRKTILLVEDEAIIAMEEAVVLEDNGYDVITASTGEEAFKTASENDNIDLILMDINLGSGLDGTEAAAKIASVCNVPLIFLSSHTEKEVVEKTEDITSYGYIVKNSGETVLLTSIKMAFKLFDAKQKVVSASNTLDSTFNSMNDAIMLLDLDNHVLKCNDALRSYLGKSDDEIIGKKCVELMHHDSRTPDECPFRRMLKSGLREKMDMPVGDRFFEVIVDPLFDSKGNLTNAVHIVTDITDIKKSEETHRDKLSEITSPELMMENLTFTDIFDIPDLEKLQSDFAKATGAASMITEPDGTPITQLLNGHKFCNLVRDTELGCIRCINSDRAMNRGMNEKLTWQKCSSAGLWEAIARINVGGKHVANWCIGQVRDDTMTVDRIIEYADELGIDPVKAVEAFMDLPMMDEAQLEDTTVLVDTITNILSKILYQNLLQSVMLSRALEDEAEIKTLLDEKEYLLKEVHHRMKNNMASVEAMLELQQLQMSSTEAREALKSVGLQVSSIRVLYDKLLHADQYTDLPLKSFIIDIVNGIKDAYSSNTQIEFITKIEELKFDSRLLFELGLIINELVTNAYKYAFDGRSSGLISLTVKKTPAGAALVLMDDGVGLPEGFDAETNSSFGIKLVRMFSEQMNGSFKIKNRTEPETGTVSRLELSLDL